MSEHRISPGIGRTRRSQRKLRSAMPSVAIVRMTTAGTTGPLTRIAAPRPSQKISGLHADANLPGRGCTYMHPSEPSTQVVSASSVASVVARWLSATTVSVLAMITAATNVDKEGAVFGLARSRIGDPDDITTAPGDGRVVWTELLSNDPAAASAFYHAVIGYDARNVERRGGQYTLLTRQGAERAGILRNPSEQATPTWLTYFGVEDAAAAAQRVEALGGKVILPPSPQLREGTMAVVTDPTGALLVLQKVSPKG